MRLCAYIWKDPATRSEIETLVEYGKIDELQLRLSDST